MLTTLYIKNVAVIEQASIDFGSGLNVFTGETGAGKSIVIDSINAILGNRTSREIVRTGCDKATITAFFTDVSKEIVDILNDFGYEIEQDELIIQREINCDAKSNAKLCGRPISASMLKDITNNLINIHGQHDSQVLLSSEKHINILDMFCEIQKELEQYKEIYAEYKDIKKKLNNISSDEIEKNQKIDLLNYQIDEIDNLELEIGEDETLEQRKKLLKNQSIILENLENAKSYLSGNYDLDGGVEIIEKASSCLGDAYVYDENLKEISEKINNLYYEIEEVSSEVSEYLDDFDVDPNELNDIEYRLDQIFKAKMKYGKTIEEILEFYENSKRQLEDIELSDVNFKKYSELLNDCKQKLDEKACELTRLRKKGAKNFIENISNELKYLDMENVSLKVDFQEIELCGNGKDKIEFLISTNLGELEKSISKIASGGELSRIMLSIKNVLANKDNVASLIFDEVDTGVSGRAAQKIGLKLKQIAKHKQIICVTHLAQIAALANNHYLIEKNTLNGKTYTNVENLEFEKRKLEIARIIGADNISETILKSAEEMLQQGENM